eukprot:GSChrysophyteH2.ASY1.ANO1.110.1 assembled CDS
MSFPNEEAKSSANALKTRLFPTNASKGDMRMRAAASTSTLVPRGMQMSKSAAMLPSGATTTGGKVSLDLNARTLSNSQSAMIFANKGTSRTISSGPGEVMLGEDGMYTMDLPPVPVDESKVNENTEHRGFLETLNLTADERHALQHVPNTFFYMRIKSAANEPVPTGKTRQSQQKAEATGNKNEHDATPVATSKPASNNQTADVSPSETPKGQNPIAMNVSTALSQLVVDDKMSPIATPAAHGSALMADFASQDSSQILNSVMSNVDGGPPMNDNERCSVYDLEVVPQEYINKDNYFTLSKEGITIYKDRGSQFTVLTQWEREHKLFNKISDIHFFAVYRRWKAFKVWKSGLRGGKMELASTALQSSLFLLSAPLRDALLNIRSHSMPMASMGMLDMPHGKVFDVDDFVSTQLAVQDGLRYKLDELSNLVLSSARQACDEVVDQFLKANNIAANHKMTFMERAALRSECRRLTRFLRMVDTMMTDFLMTMISEAMEKLDGSAAPAAVAGDDEVDQHAHFDPMYWSPTQDTLTRSIDSVIANSCEVVCSFVKVLTAHDTEMYVMPEGDDEDEDDDEGVDFATTIQNTPFFVKSKDMIHRYIRYNYNAINEYCNIFDPFRAMFYDNQKYSNDVSEIFALGEVEAFEKSIKFYKDQISKFSEVPRFADVGGILVDTAVMKTEMTPSPINCINSIKEWLPKLAAKCAQVLVDKVGDMNPVVGGDPNSVENFVVKKKVKDAAAEGLDDYKETQSYVNSLLFLMDDNGWTIPDSVKATVRMLKEGLETLEKNITTAEGKEEDDAKKFATNVTEEVPKLIKKVKDKLQEYQNILRLNVDEFEVLEDVGADLALKLRLWTDKAAWNEMRTTILNAEINGLDVKSLEKDLEKFNRTVFLASKGLPMSKVVPKLKESVEEFNPVLPLVNDLGSLCLKDRHWNQITELVAIEDTPPNAAFTVIDLIDKGITRFQEEVQVISTAAQQEAILEEMMGKVTAQWDNLDFNVINYKDIKDLYVLGDTSEVTQSLDDCLVTINTVLGSRYVGGIRSYVDMWRAKLMLFQETLDEWQTCQRNWMYLEVIFGSADIIRQLPGPAKIFQFVDKSWKFIMKMTADEPNALMCGTKDKTRLETFKQHNANLDQIQKDLEDYLETKRMAFPRFYFLSNDELLEILSQAKEPRAVQPHLRKCFDNLIKLEFGSEEGSWLTAVEKRMKDSLHGLMKAGLHDYDQRPRDEWIGLHAGQIVATVAQMTWARDTETALRGEDKSSKDDLSAWSIAYKAELQKLIAMIRSPLTALVRKIVVALVTTDVHARDIIDELQEREVESPMDFLWQQQLRYYWKVDVDDCRISHSDALVNYGYEYMGATSRLVITPLTDRCWLTLTGSYALKLGGAPAGPAGTGKTESSKDLAKAIGIQCVVFNCSDQIDYKMMGKLFRGLAQGGSWVCLDEFNRIDIEDRINFMGINISLIDHHVIITMNPGYAGRTELPDNLQVCFRPVSMMVPNYALIAEIMLFAEGFGDAKNLSRKMCKLYILCSEQLSQQPHYDYGLRAVKSVLVMAGAGKRGNPDLSEDLVLIRALRDSNVPKFLAEDLPLFAAIVLDLFPGIEIPPDDYGELSVALNEEILKAGLQLVPKFIGKVIQMFDIFNIRFGATIVGPAGTGKTSIYRILAALMINLRAKGSKNPLFQNVKFQILNPKSIAMGELYGEFHPLTQEWHDGLVPAIFRNYVDEESDDKRWTVFDGPIDALWIENMNTVLDDNMTLCLANGQRIKLKSEMKCLFEVNDLAVASPATVSRIGVVYVTPTDLGWFPYIQSWVVREFPIGEGEGFFPEFITTRLLQLFECCDIQIVISMCTLFKALFHVDNGLCPSLGMPGSGTPFDYYVDTKEGVFKNWTEIIPTFVYDAQAPYFDLMVPTADTTRFSYVMTHLIRVDKPCFITGVTGTGKTVASLVVQTSIESKLEKKRKNLLGAPSGRKVVVFVDDINMPTVETYGAQPPVELLRQLLDHKGFYDRDKIFWKELENVLLFVGAAPPGGGRAPVTGRFTRHFNKMCDGCVTGTIEMYHRISEELLPTPSKFHYTFNLRDISKVFQGVLMIRPRKCQEPETFAKLWVHECQRIFYDRFINTDDQDWFKKQICETLSRHLKMPMSEGDLFDKPIVFIDFLKPDADPKFYECAPDLVKLTAVLDDQLDNYNVEFPTQMNLPRGNAMLIGVGGSGKQSLTKIASFVGGMQYLVFLFTDSQIVDETMLEDLNNVLNTGEVANLFAADETDQIVASMIEVCKANGIAETRDNCLSYFVSRVRDKLHIVLCMSPVGDALRVRCRQFPSLINCTTIDWFHGWPEAALVSVSQRFLANIDLGSADTQAAVVQMCGFVHRSIEKMSVAFYNELRRRIYTTPKSYLDLISLYMSMLKGLQDVVEVNSDRMKVGVTKLTETNDIVETLRGELEKLGPVLKEKGEAASAMLTQVAKDSAEANIVAETVGKEEAIVGKQAAETKAVADDAQKDLDRALPALESAIKALNSLTKADITEVKSFPNPPNAVRIVMEAICILLGEEPKWENSKKLLNKSDFIEMLQTYDKDNIPAARLKKLRRDYVNVPEFQPETVEKVSKAGLGLCLWARAMDVYADVAKEVEPKKARLKIMTEQLKEVQATLKVKQDALKEVLDKVAELTRICDETVAEKEKLQFESDQTAQRLIRAEKLTNGLNSEGVRWKAAIDTLAQEHTDLIGDCFLSCACISYYGGFTGVYREKLIGIWLEKTVALRIPASKKWQNQGLPTDDVSVNNGILVDKCRRWPLMIDPQMQANSWLRKKEEANDVQITTMNDTNLLRVLEKCIRLAIFKQGARRLIRLGDSDVDYDDLFKLYMTTKMPNPHYLPEVCIKVTILNFTVTVQGLTDQLLGDVVKAERPDIEERKVQLMLNMAEDKKQLAALEAKILKMLSESEGNILDDEVLINTLSESKLTSIAIGERVAEAEITEVAINDTRSKYIVDPMYQYSLAYYNMLFNRCIDMSEKSKDLDTRLKNIIDYTTLIIYQNICRGLFEKDKLLFSSLVCFQIMKDRGVIHEIEWNVLVRGPGAIDKVKQPMNPHPDLISAPAWNLIYGIEDVLQYTKPVEKAAPNPDSEWTAWMKSPNIMEAPLPAPYNETVNNFQKLLLVKALREDKLQGAIATYVGMELGKPFATSPVASMADIYEDINNSTPCIFILSSGADPTGTLLRFAKGKNYGDRLHIVSLGQGQGPVAKGLIDLGCGNGDWVCLQNCMLAKSWMPALDKIVSDVQARVKPIHKDFRLFLTSSPATYFPVSVLQNGVKMTNEPPKGFRANLLGNFANVIKEDDWEDEEIKLKGREVAWKKILCGLSFFHAQVQERRKFGPLGWNIRYAFDESDFETSVAVLKRFLTEQDIIPWDAINFATGHINYGGRVTDDWDRRTLMGILGIFMVTDILEDSYAFSKSGTYYAPVVGSKKDMMEYFEQLPHSDDPEVFGMHDNANVTFNTNESLVLMESILTLQPRASGGGAEVFESEAPDILDTETEAEIVKFNRLMNKMRSSLRDVKRAIRGMIVMSADLDDMYASFLNNKVPPIWEKVSFASLKTLASWVRDMVSRVAFMRLWLVNGQPATFPLPVFFFPQGFMTASLQTFARKHMEAIDGLSFEFEVLRNGLQPELITEGPEDGVIVHGLFMEGARFDHETWKVTDSQPGKMYDLLPAIYFKPAVNHKQAPNTYACPVYKTAVRKGVLSTTGMSTNFVVPVEMPINTNETEQKYILAGCAAILNLTD